MDFLTVYLHKSSLDQKNPLNFSQVKLICKITNHTFVSQGFTLQSVQYTTPSVHSLQFRENVVLFTILQVLVS